MTEVRKFNYREAVKTPVGTLSRTKQSLAAETDINYIVHRFKASGGTAHVNALPAKYGDFSEVTELKAMFDLVDQAVASFEALPAAVRSAAHNDPIRLAEMIASPEGMQALLKAENKWARPSPLVPTTPTEAGGKPPEEGGPTAADAGPQNS